MPTAISLGFDMDPSRAVGEKLGVDVEIRTCPGFRSLPPCRGKIDMVIAAMQATAEARQTGRLHHSYRT